MQYILFHQIVPGHLSLTRPFFVQFQPNLRSSAAMSTSVSSPAHRYDSDYDKLMYESNFTADISNKMRVPSKILVTGEGKNNAVDLLPNKVSAEAEMWEKVPMSVPDRIVVTDIGVTLLGVVGVANGVPQLDKCLWAKLETRRSLKKGPKGSGQKGKGHEEHIGLRAPPRELHLEQTMSQQPSLIRVETPPRVLTLDHYFPTEDDDDDSDDEKKNNENPKRQSPLEPVIERNALSINPETPHGGYPDASTMSPTELEASTLRRHLSKLNRRVLLLEHESQLHQQREIIILTLGIAYFALKVLRWLHHHW